MSVRDIMIQKLTDRFAPSRLEVIEESDQHHGHAGWREGGETHFRVRIATRQFAGLSRVAQHREVMAALKDELDSGVHALAIEVREARRGTGGSFPGRSASRRPPSGSATTSGSRCAASRDGERPLR